MQQNARDLIGAGVYLCAIGLLSIALGAGATALKAGPEIPLFERIAETVDSQPDTTTRLSEVVRNSQKMRAALARPIAAPEPLPPITAQLAYGHLRPGSKKAAAVAKRFPRHALDALAMDVSVSERSYTPPELHKVY